MPTTKQIYNRHVKTLFDSDLDAVMADYSADAVLITADKTYKGLKSIRGFFTNLIKNMVPDVKNFEHTPFISGDYVLMVWDLDFKDGTGMYGVDTFVITNGKIVGQTVKFFEKAAKGKK